LSAAINTATLSAWLEAHPPQNLLTYVDRLLIATVGNFRERSSLLAKGEEELAYVIELEKNGTILKQITNVLVLLTLLREEGIETEEYRHAIQSSLVTAREYAFSWWEPFRSTFFSWLYRSGLGQSLPVGPDPWIEILRLYHTTHRILFAGDYGRKAVPRAPFDEALRACDSIFDRNPRNGDALGEMLLVEAMLIPRNEQRCEMLRSRLEGLQSPDGSIAMPSSATAEGIHHAACVALLAERLIESPPSMESIADSRNFD
jgi:hypothetical protein